MTPGVVGAATRAPHLPRDDAETGPLISFARSGIATHWKARRTRAFWSWRRRVTCPSGGRAAPASVITASGLIYGSSPISLIRSIRLQKEMSSSAAPGRRMTW
jgi:hypothetical protein